MVSLSGHSLQNFKNQDGGEKELFFFLNKKSRNANGCSRMVELLFKSLLF